MKAFVVDVNLPITANGSNSAATPSCAIACAHELKIITSSGMVVLDTQKLIFNEYKRHLSFRGEPGVGDKFFKWVVDNFYTDRCELVEINPHPNDPYSFQEFPSASELEGLDPADRKYVAVAVASKNNPEIIAAIERGWAKHRKSLQNNGIQVRLLCQPSRAKVTR